MGYDYLIDQMADVVYKQIARDEDNQRWLRLIHASKQWEASFVDGFTHDNKKVKGLAWAFGEQGQEAVDRFNGKKLFKKSADAEDLIEFAKWDIYYEEFNQLLLPMVIGDWAEKELGRIIIGVSFDIEAPTVLEFIDNYSYKFRNINEETASLLNAELRKAVEAGEGIPQITKRIRTLFTGMQKERAYMIARTETLRAMNAGTEESYIQSGVVISKVWLTALDERTCPFCSEMNGKELGLGGVWYEQGSVMTVIDAEGKERNLSLNYEPILRPPLHPYCRCCLKPVVL